MIAALAVLGLVVNGGAAIFKLHLGQSVVALEVGGVVLSVPQAELDEAVQAQLLFFAAFVGQLHLGHLGAEAAGNHHGLLGLDAVLAGGDGGVAGADAALIAVQLGLGGLPAGIPDGAVVVDVEVVSASIGGHVVVAIAGEAQQAGVLAEGVAAGGVAHQGEEVFAAQIVDPGIGSVRSGDDILASCVIKETIFHRCGLLQVGFGACRSLLRHWVFVCKTLHRARFSIAVPLFSK